MSQTQTAQASGMESFAALFEESLTHQEMRQGEVITAEIDTLFVGTILILNILLARSCRNA